MRDTVLRLYVKMQGLKDALVEDESGQDLVEYALVVGLIALGAIAAMSVLGKTISNAFTNVGTTLSTYTT